MGDVTKIKIKPSVVSWNDDDLGYLEGDIEVKLTESLKEIKTHQTGDQTIGNVRTGNDAEVTLTLKESDVVRLKAMISASGSSYTPTSGTAVTGWGTERLGTGTFADAKRLVIRGINAGSDHTEDLTFWKAYPVLESLKFSGNDFQVIPVTFKIYNDSTKNAKVSLFAIGDSTQSDFDDE